MAYVPQNLSLGFDLIGGSRRVWVYQSEDAFSTVDDAGYFSDASARGMKVGDILFAVRTDSTAVTIARVSAISAGAGTVVEMLTSGGAISFSDLTATGDVTVAGTLEVTGATTLGALAVMPRIPAATVAALGSTQANAAAVTTGFTLVTAADATKGVRLPTAVAGSVAIIKNDDAADAVLKIYPATDDAINAIAADAALSIAAKTSVMLVALDATTWYSLPLLPS